IRQEPDFRFANPGRNRLPYGTLPAHRLARGLAGRAANPRLNPGSRASMRPAAPDADARRVVRPARLFRLRAAGPGLFRLTEDLMSTQEVYSPGLEGVIAGETAISTVEGGLRYRGYPVTELAEKASFDEVAYLLLFGELPTSSQLADFHKRLANARKMPDSLCDLLKALPKDATPMDVVRTGVSILAHYDPEVTD